MGTNLISVKSLGHLTSADTQVQTINETLTRLSITLKESSKGLRGKNPPTNLVRDLAYIAFCFGVAKVALEKYVDSSGTLVLKEGDDVNNVINRNILCMKNYCYVVMTSFAELFPIVKPKQAKLLRFIESRTSQIDLLLCWIIILRFEPCERSFPRSEHLVLMDELIHIARNTSMLLNLVIEDETVHYVVNASDELCRLI